MCKSQRTRRVQSVVCGTTDESTRMPAGGGGGKKLERVLSHNLAAPFQKKTELCLSRLMLLEIDTRFE
jgi:hypothetical protein